MKKVILLFLLFFSFSIVHAQVYFPKNSSLKKENSNYTVFTNATLYITPTQKIDNGTLVIKDGKVIAVGSNVTIPKNSIITDLKGKYIYPSFIDPYSNFGVSKPEKVKWKQSPQWESNRSGFYWNDHIMPENNAIDNFKYVSKKAKELRNAGFGVVNSHIMDGIARGTGVLVSLNDNANNSERILVENSGNYFSFSKSVASRQRYPGSLMGASALLRQMNYDADWYAKGNSKTNDRSLEALIKNKNLPSFIEAGNKYKDVLADKTGDLFNLNYIIVGGGDEYESLESIKATQASYIIPINFPKAYDVSDPYAANYISIADMRAWNQAPSNPKVLSDNGVSFSLTTHQLKSPADFKKHLNRAFEYGFDKTKALEALTTVPAQLLGQSDKVGSLQVGRYANFLITSGEIFEKKTILYENWVQGTKNVLVDKEIKDIRGTYTTLIGGKNYSVLIKGELAKLSSEVKLDSIKYPSKISYKDNWVNLSFSDKDKTESFQTTSRISSEENITGKVIMPNGSASSFTARKLTSEEEKSEDSEKNKSDSKPELVPITFPNVGYGSTTLPISQNILFKNATVWTSEKEGILQHTDVLIKNGKISKIGTNLSSGNATVIDATGKHLTAGIIDEHSHIAAFSINESGHNSSAEVSIEDVLDPEDIDIYRNLAGGVTSIQILHGSANPIGGRSAIIKLKWGEDADGLLYTDRPKFIKFALGENVKQSNWQSYNRFPQTRMGVEQLYVNYFNRAKEYDTKKKSGATFRYDEEMEVLAEILNGERFISCHSYVQSEINMLMKVAEKFNFRVNTFTHILEGYKVADKMKSHGVGASTFSDWWAYKFEVNDAIPYNAAIMTNEGVTVAINSDDGEMSRRLNQEAAKTIKYGGMTELQAWNMVTINPAKLLHLDHRVGSIKEGKDADLVLWNDNPLSIYAKAEKTLIEGAVYFDMELDKQKRSAIKKERNTLIKMMLKEKEGGSKTQAPKRKGNKEFHCETIN
ncbi:MAG: imidazolonepropionase-like amidohydrolase [Flavobacteriaceae bacterium]|jgi:imidazolonepropionase-like amidohydrolase|uniref:amidohydrolase family protein n=1 Tax=Candidatus Marifrigoribacter sp. Uisw_064 TaxID=3230970 RepID=UPI003AD9BB49